MRVAVLGASGGIGAELVKQARARGWDVVAITRPTSKVALPDGVTHRTGDLTDAAFLGDAFAGCDAIASGLGLRMPGIAPWHRPEDPTFLTRAAPAIVAGARAAGVRRVVVVTAGGVGESRPKVPMFFRAMIASTALRHAYAELEVLEQALFASGLDVCVARPGGLTDGPRTGVPVVIDAMTGPASISRADVAAWMLEQLTFERFPHRAALIAPA